MKDEYDFSKGEKGKFYNRKAKFAIPIAFSKEHLRIGAFFSFMGSILFTFIEMLVSAIRSPGSFVVSFEMIIVFGLFGLIAFFLALLPASFCVAIITYRIDTKDWGNIHSYRKIVLEGAVLGVVASLGIGLFFSFLNWVVFVSNGHGSMRGPICHTIIGVVVGTIIGSIASYLLAKRDYPPDSNVELSG